MRVTFINLWPRGGMLHYSSHLANALADHGGMAVTMFLAKGADTRLLSPGIDVQYVATPMNGKLSELPKNLWRTANVTRFLRAVQDSRPDIIHVNSSHLWLIGALPYLSRHYPLVATVHDIQPHPGENTLRKRLERRTVYRCATRIAVHSEHLRQQLLEDWPNRRADDVIVTPHGGYRFTSDSQTPGKSERPTVLFFGRILKYKGLQYLIGAAPRVRERIPDVRFVIAGEGSVAAYPQLQSDPSLFELRNRFVPDEDVADCFRLAWLLVLPYTEASWTGVASIAQNAGLPVVATQVGCLPEVVRHGQDGIIVPPQDSEALAEAITALLENDELRRRYGCAGQAAARSDWNAAADILKETYAELSASRV